MVDCFQKLSEDSSCRVVVLTGEGQSFTSGVSLSLCYFLTLVFPPTGLDLMDFAPMFTQFQAAGDDICSSQDSPGPSPHSAHAGQLLCHREGTSTSLLSLSNILLISLWGNGSRTTILINYSTNSKSFMV